MLVGALVGLLSLGVSCLPQLWRDRGEEKQCYFGGVRGGKGTEVKAGEDGILAHSVLGFPSSSFFFCPWSSTHQSSPT